MKGNNGLWNMCSNKWMANSVCHKILHNYCKLRDAVCLNLQTAFHGNPTSYSEHIHFTYEKNYSMQTKVNFEKSKLNIKRFKYYMLHNDISFINQYM